MEPLKDIGVYRYPSVVGFPADAADSDVFLNLGEQFSLSRVHGWYTGPYETMALKVRGPDGDVVAYIDEDGDLRHKGMVFEGWTAWDYWE